MPDADSPAQVQARRSTEFFGPLVPGQLGCVFDHVEPNLVIGHLDVTPPLIAGTGFLRPNEISRLRRIVKRRRGAEPAGVMPEAVEQAGEIVSADVTNGV